MHTSSKFVLNKHLFDNEANVVLPNEGSTYVPGTVDPNRFYAGPVSGTTALFPTFRRIVAKDLGEGADNTKYLRGDMTWAAQSTPGLEQVVGAGNSVNNGLIYFFGTVNNSQAIIDGQNGKFIGEQLALKNGNNQGIFVAPVLTGLRTYNMPDKSGTVAMTSDIPAPEWSTQFIVKHNTTDATQTRVYNSELNQDAYSAYTVTVTVTAVNKDNVSEFYSCTRAYSFYTTFDVNLQTSTNYHSQGTLAVTWGLSHAGFGLGTFFNATGVVGKNIDWTFSIKQVGANGNVVF